MYDEDTTEVFFKCFVVAIAQLIQQKLNVSFNDALIKSTKFDIYNSYMQAETVDEIVEYAIKYKLV
jgi:isocitrate dehydrogenase